MKAHTRFLSIILALMLILGTVVVAPVSVSAAETDTQDVSADSNVNITATNTLGEMMTDLQKQEEAEQQNNQYANSICDIVIDREKKTADVDLRAFCDAKLTVAIFEDESGLFALSGMIEIKTDKEKPCTDKVTVQLDTGKELPDYFTVRAFLTDPMTNIPLAQVYECDTYTRQMQEFLAKTVDDFDEEDVLNLDDDKTKNFLVFGEGTLSISSEQDNVNRLASRDDENHVYTFENIDDQFKNYSQGDVLTYHEGLSDMLIIKIDSISLSGKNATITGSETHIEDAFDFVKIDSTGCNDKVETDFSDLPEAVSPESGENKKDIAGTGATWVDEEMSSSITVPFSIEDNDEDDEDDHNEESGISADLSVDLLVNVSLGVEVKCYYASSWGERDADFSFIIKSEIELTGNICLTVEASYPLGYYEFMPIPCITVGVEPALVFRGELSAELSGSVSAQQGKRYKNGEITDLSKSPDWKGDFSLKASVFIGLSLNPNVRVCGVLAKAELTAEAGVEISVSSSLSDILDDSVHHTCLEKGGTCIEGEISVVVDLSFKVELCKFISATAKVLSINEKFSDFYISSVCEPQLGFTTCPNKTYRIDFTIVDPNSNPVNSVTVESIRENTSTVSTGSGNASMYLHRGEAQITLSKNGVKYNKKINVKEPGAKALTFGATVSATEMQENTHHWDNSVNYYLTGDGVLYLFPRSENGSIGTYDGNGGLTQNEMKQAVKKVIITKGFKTISGTDAFRGYSSLRSVVVPNGIESIGMYAFEGCSALSNVTLPNGLKTIWSGAFWNCTALKSITLPNSLTKIASGAFQESGLTQITIPNSVTEISSDAFSECESLTTVKCDRRVSAPTSTNGSVNINAFRSCTSLRSVDLPDNIESIGMYAFEGCSALSNVTLPNGLKTIWSGAFWNCTALKSITLPNSLTKIASGAFQESGLIQITIPNSVTKIASDAFFGCNSLTTIIYGGTQEAWDKMIDKNDIPATATVICTGKGIAQTAAAKDYEFADTAADEAVPEEIAETSVTNSENSEVDPESTIASDKTDLATTGDTTVNNDENTVTRDHLVPGTEALFIIVSGTKDNYSFGTESLLYIDQKTVDENGTVSFSAPPTAAADSKVSVIYGQCAHEADKPSALDHGSATITYCKHCGDAINIQGEDTGAYLPGDIDGDGEVTIIDATYIRRYCVKLPIPIPEEYVMRGDINRDGELNVIDATWIQRLEAGLYVAN